MNIKFNNSIKSGSYAEVGQTNKLRWINCFREQDGTFSHESLVWKCKDFLNEIVRKYQGQDSSIYGYNAGSMRVNEEGVWHRLLFIHDIEVFKKNLGSISKLPGYVPLEIYDCEQAPQDTKQGLMVLIPKYYFENTYRISVLTYIMRICNVDKVIEDFINHPTKSIDNTSPKHHDAIIKRGFVEPVKGYWYYVGKEHTNLKSPCTSTVHNCGMNAWMEAATKEGLA